MSGTSWPPSTFGAGSGAPDKVRTGPSTYGPPHVAEPVADINGGALEAGEINGDHSLGGS